jgi:hypothetical protein
MIFDDFYMFPAQFKYVIIQVMYSEGHIQFVDQCASVKVASSAQNLVMQNCSFKK